jgi:hypothetical protein
MHPSSLAADWTTTAEEGDERAFDVSHGFHHARAISYPSQWALSIVAKKYVIG